MKPWWLLTWVVLAAVPAWGQEVQIPNVLVKLIDQIDLPAREAGLLTALHAKEGDQVQAGALIVRLDDAEARLAQQRAKAEFDIAARQAQSDIAVRSAKRALETADSELKRAEEARRTLRDVVSESELEKLKLAADQSKLAAEKAVEDLAVAGLARGLKQVAIAVADQAIERRQAVAPFPGVVVEIYKRPGEWVEPGQKLVRLVRLDRLRVEGFVDVKLAAQRLAGKPVSLTVDLPAQPGARFNGELVFVSPEIDPRTQQVRVIAEIENPQFLLQPGLRGTLRLSGASVNVKPAKSP